MKHFKPLLKNKNFIYIWSSQILSQLTINIMNFVLLIRIFEQTGSTIATSLFWIAGALPAAIIGPIAATSVDLIDKRKMLWITNLLQSLVIFLYAISHRSSEFLLYGIVMAYSFLNQFYVPSEAATLPSVLPKSELPQGNSLFFITQQGSLIVGFGLAGFLRSLLGFGTTLYLCSALSLFAFISVLFLPPLKSIQSEKKNFEQSIGDFFERIIEGYSFIKSNKKVWVPFGLLIGLQVVLSVVVVTTPVMAKDILGISLNNAGLFMVIPAAVGALGSAAILPKLIEKGWRKKKLIETSLMVSTFMFLLITFVVTNVGDIYRIMISSFAIFFLGVSYVGIVIPAQTYLQEATPGGFRGRVFGNFWFLVTIVTIFPTIFSGTIVELFGIKFLLTILSAISLAILVFSKRYGYKFIGNNVKAYA